MYFMKSLDVSTLTAGAMISVYEIGPLLLIYCGKMYPPLGGCELAAYVTLYVTLYT